LQVTTRFANFIKSQPEKYAGLMMTGHSLGGGLAIISGAQTGVDAVALSGPNAMLSGISFRPPITADALDKHTFVSCLVLATSTNLEGVSKYVIRRVKTEYHPRP
jgi:putative lipase involved disintegration of autophagic bodies